MALKLVKDAGQAEAVGQEDLLIAVLAWLGTEISDEDSELKRLAEHLAALAACPSARPQLQRALDLFQDRALKVTQVFKRRLSDAGIPLPKPLRSAAADLITVHGVTAGCYQRLLGAAVPEAGRRQRNSSLPAARALRSLAEQLEVSALASGSVPSGMWRDAHRLYQSYRREAGPQDTLVAEHALDADRIYRQMLALSGAQPARLAPKELRAAVDYIARFAAAVEIGNEGPAGLDSRRFWFDVDEDMPPVAAARKTPDARPGIRFMSCARLGLLATEQIRELEAGTPAEHLHLPRDADEPAYRLLLQRLHECWVQPPIRQLKRRRQQYRVEACLGFEAVKHLFAPDSPVRPSSGLSEWIVLNQSPAGFAVMHVRGEVRGLTPGGVLALRSGQGKPWDICIVRWVRADQAVELGLQVLASGARLVRVAFRNARTTRSAVEGLLLPPAAAVRAHPAVLVPVGTCASRRFLMVMEEHRTHVVQGRLVSLDVRTAQVELFEFQPDPYPI